MGVWPEWPLTSKLIYAYTKNENKKSHDKRQFNIELQKRKEDNLIKRSRFYSSVLDQSALFPAEKYDEMPDTYVIMVLQNDILGGKKPIYHIERMIPETKLPFGDGNHIIFVNGEMAGEDTPLSRMLHDFQEADPDRLYSDVLRNRMKQIKGSKEESSMKTKWDIYLDEEREEGKAEGQTEVRTTFVKGMDAQGLPAETIAAAGNISVEEVKKILEAG